MTSSRAPGAVALLLVVALAAVVSPVLPAIVFGGFIVLVGHEPFERLVAAVRANRSLAAALATAGITLAVVAPVAATVAYGAHEATVAARRLSRELESGNARKDLLAHLPPALADELPRLLEGVRESAPGLAGSSARLLPRAIGSAGKFLVFCLLTIVVMLFGFRDGPALVALLEKTSPLPPAHTARLLHEFREVALGLFRGGVLVAVFHGTTAALGLLMFGIPQAVLLGLLCAVASFVPIVGTGLIAIPIVVSQFLAGNVHRAFGLAVWFMLIVGAGDHLLRPVFSKGRMALPRPLLFLTIFGGLFLFGPPGVLVGPLVGSLCVVSLQLRAEAS